MPQNNKVHEKNSAVALELSIKDKPKEKKTKRGKEISITFIGGGRVVQNYLSAIKPLYDQMPSVLPDVMINIVLPEGSLTAEYIKDPLLWGQYSTKHIRINVLEENESGLERIVNESDLRVLAFSGIKWSSLAKEEHPRIKEIEVNGKIAKKYAERITKNYSKTINITNQTETIATIVQKILYENTMYGTVIPFGMRLDTIRMQTYILNNSKETNKVIKKGNIDKIQICGIHGLPFVLINKILDEKQKSRQYKDNDFFYEVLNEQLKIREYAIEYPKEIVKNLNYLPDMITGPEILNVTFDVLGINKYLKKKFVKKNNANFKSNNYQKYLGNITSLKKLIKIFQLSEEKFFELPSSVTDKLLPKEKRISEKKLKQLEDKTKFVFYSGPKSSLNYNKYSRSDYVLAYLGLTDLFEAYLTAVKYGYL